MTKDDLWPRRVEALHAAYADRVLGYLVYAGGRRAEAEDLAQEVWVRVTEALREGRYREEGKAEAWLFTIVRNLWMDRRVRRVPAPPLKPSPPAPPDLLEARELEDRWRQAVQALPQLQREVYLLRMVGELPFREISEQLERPLGTVLSQMHEAMKGLKATLLESSPC